MDKTVAHRLWAIKTARVTTTITFIITNRHQWRGEVELRPRPSPPPARFRRPFCHRRVFFESSCALGNKQAADQNSNPPKEDEKSNQSIDSNFYVNHSLPPPTSHKSQLPF
jgi:hypothetical protein